MQAAAASYLATRGKFTRSSLGLTQTLVARRDAGLALTVSGDAITQSAALPAFALTLSRDAYASLRLDLQGWRRFADGDTLSGNVRLSQGIAGRATPTGGQVPNSQAGASNTYTKFEARLAWRTLLDPSTNLVINARGQTSFGAPLLLSEKAALAAIDGISAATPGTFDADSGLVLRDELARTFTLKSRSGPIELTPYLFSSVGFGWLEQPDKPTRRFDIQAVGAGMRWNVPLGGALVRVSMDYGRCFCASVLARDGNRFNLSTSVAF